MHAYCTFLILLHRSRNNTFNLKFLKWVSFVTDIYLLYVIGTVLNEEDTEVNKTVSAILDIYNLIEGNRLL